MASKIQMRAWRYVEEGRYSRLKSLLRKNPDLDLSFSQGKRKRSPLHLACSPENDDMVRLLLRHGADVLLQDRKGNTALHKAAELALEHGKTVYDDLVVPLKRSCPAAMTLPNSAGVTPQDLLDFLDPSWFEENPRNNHRSPEPNLEGDWMEKLVSACEDEHFEMFGLCEADGFLYGDEDEEYEDWFEKVRLDYVDKKLADAQRRASWFTTRKKGNERNREEERKQAESRLKALQKEHQEYLARAARKEEETRQGKKRSYEERCQSTFHAAASASTSSNKLRYADIPWPVQGGTVQEMADVMLHGADRKDAAAFRKTLWKAQKLWHPDKFAQRCEARLEDKDKQRILDTVKALSQELNRLAQGLRT